MYLFQSIWRFIRTGLLSPAPTRGVKSPLGRKRGYEGILPEYMGMGRNYAVLTARKGKRGGRREKKRKYKREKERNKEK